MKHFVYFDKDFINSYLSQIDHGLVTSIKEEINNLLENGQTESINPEHMSREAEGSIMGAITFGSTTHDATFNTSTSTKQTKIDKELISKVIHDDSYDKLVEDLKDKNLLKYSSEVERLNTGDYVCIKNNINIINLSDIIDVYDDNFYEIYTEVAKENQEESFTKLSKNQRNSTIQKELKEIKKGIKMMKLMAKMLPSDTFIMHGDFLIPLDKIYFREEPSSIKFKYTEEIHILGRVTGELRNVLATEEESGILNEVLYSLNDLTLNMLGMLAPGKNLQVLYPISLYFK